ncbi:DNA recombination protein RmuC [Marivirga arenosa]|uniref:DNA recombination protein RmuC n=1 Tax=Marivirga arenosa TaxID=3059076 RepID=A0AA52EZ59_9BACT|nr:MULTISPECIES: DNA recombination protein RmuC [unclassified Marivirga]WKK85271.2 DNA recombination protein RmuC [Marivirga sp. ABR2-2]WNB17378.1 DNA recombination protein RmuC [Marivirga sp. BKB1-2]
MEIIAVVIGLVIGGVLAYFILKSQNNNSAEIDQINNEKQKLQTDLSVAMSQKENLYAELKEEKDAHSKEREKNVQLNRQLSTVESDYKNLKIKLDEHKAELAELQQQFKNEFKNLAQEIFEEKSKKFTDQNKTNLGELLNPLKERIEKFEEKVEKSNKDSLVWNSALKEQISSLKELNQQITKEAENLTKALKGDSKSQGNWGEMQLEAILEKVGLQKDVHYEKEKNYKNEEGSNQRLDYIIKMPDDKYLVLDSKVSLTAYSNYFDADDDTQRARFLKNHLDSINTHIKTLGDKNYQNLYDINQPDYVLMFIANEPALTIALKEDHSLYEKALDRNIVLVSTTTLMATLRTISYIWKQDLQNKNAIEIATQAGALYDKFTNFTDDLLKVGNNLKTTQNSYSDAMKKLYEGKGNLIRRTEILRELGAKTTKTIDKRLLDRSSE